MNQEKIGKFIATLRKEKKLTQENLAKKLGITDRAISKWENGRGLPDLSLMMPLCKELNITINELLSGEKLKKETYKEKFEENIINTINYSNKEIKKKNKIIYIIVLLVLILTIFMTLFIIDINRIENNEPVFFSDWGVDYYPNVDMTQEKIEDAILEYVIEEGDNEISMSEGEKTFAAIKIYKIEENKNNYIVYAWILCEIFFMKNGELEEGSGYSIPHKITITKNNINVVSMEIPRDGSLYADDMKELFPYSVRKEIDKLHKDGTFEKLDLKIERDVKLYFHK